MLTRGFGTHHELFRQRATMWYTDTHSVEAAILFRWLFKELYDNTI